MKPSTPTTIMLKHKAFPQTNPAFNCLPAVLFAAAFTLSLWHPAHLRAACGWDVEVKLGYGQGSKLTLFKCGEGCEARFFKVHAYDGSLNVVKTSTRTRPDGTLESSCTGRSFELLNGGIVKTLTVDPVTCLRTITDDEYTGYFTRYTYSGTFWNSNQGYDSSFCEDTLSPTQCPMCQVGVGYTTNYTEGLGPPCNNQLAVQSGSQRIVEPSGACTTESIHRIETVGNSYADEYRTEDIIEQARMCAENSMPAEFSKIGNPVATFSLAPDRSSTGLGASIWRIAIYNATSRLRYKIHLRWSINDNGTIYLQDEYHYPWGTDDEVWYFPSAAGKFLEPTVKTTCGYTFYEKTLVTATVEPLPSPLTPADPVSSGGGSALPGWSPAAGNSGCSSCTGGGLEGVSLFSLDFGPGIEGPAIGSISLHPSGPSPLLGTPAALDLSREPISQTESQSLVILKNGEELRQISTSRLFIDISRNTEYKYTIRVMQKQAQGTIQSDGYFSYDSNPAYLLKQYTIENPDASPTLYNKVRITDLSSGNVQWNCEYLTSLAGWRISLPANAGKLEVISTNNTANASTQIRRHLNSSDQIIAEAAQAVTNFPWGQALLSETKGIGAEARTRSFTYYDPPPFPASSSRPPLKTVTEPNGGWRTVLSYDTDGRVKYELSGIDTAPTLDTNQCRSIVYSYDPEDPEDYAGREPNSPRRVDEYWKGKLIGRTYHVYASYYHKTVECPNPTATNPIGAPENLVSMVVYSTLPGAFNWVLYRVNPDGTVIVPSMDIYSPTFTTDEGQPYTDNPGVVRNGTRTVEVIRPTRTLESRMIYAISDGAQGPLISSVIYSGFDDFDRPTRADYLDGTYETFSHSCCGLDIVTDRNGLTTLVEYDVLRRPVGRTTLSYQKTISLTNILDAAGRPTTYIRNAGGTSVMQQKSMTYDTAGRVASETTIADSIYSTSTHLETVPGGVQSVTLRPDGGTITNLYLQDGSPLKITGTAVFPVQHSYAIETEAGVHRLVTTETKLNSNWSPTTEWVKRYQDGLGRAYKTVYAGAGTPTGVTIYNANGQLEAEVDPDGVTTLHRYDLQGRHVITAIDVDKDGFVANYDTGAPSGKDRITEATTAWLADGAPGNTRGYDIQRTETKVWTTDGQANIAKIQTVDTSTDGLRTWQTVYRDQSTPVETRTEVAKPTAGNNWTRTVTQTGPDNSTVVTAYQYGRLISVNRGALGQTIYGYDDHGRQNALTDARSGTTWHTFNSADLVTSVTTPPPGNGQPPQTTTTLYDISLRGWKIMQPDGTSVTNEFFPTGLLKKTYGSRTYPVEYTYDYAGRMKTLTTWTNFPTTGAATTTWNYGQYRGWLDNKQYADGTGPSYQYTPGGRLSSRTWARTALTQYAYGLSGAAENAHGDLLAITYTDPQNTPAVSFDYDRRGRQKAVTQGSNHTVLSYNDANQLTSETHDAGTLNGLTVTVGYDNKLRRDRLQANTQPALDVGYTFKPNSSQLDTVTDTPNNLSATYSYLANSPLVGEIGFKNNGSPVMTTTKQFDFLNRLSSISSSFSSSSSSSIGLSYVYNSANERTRSTLADGSFWIYDYDSFGQVTSGKKYWADGSPFAGQQFEYRYDTIGNRTTTRAGGDPNGSGLRQAVYATDYRNNKYLNRTVPGGFDVIGAALPTVADLQVNGVAPYRRLEYFRGEVAADNGSSAVWQSVNVTGTGETTVSGNVFVPRTPEGFGHDADGNLTSDGRWSYAWDAENRPIRMTASTAVGPQHWLEFEYDWRGRRIVKKIGPIGSGTPTNIVKFLYDGWNLLATLNSLLATLNSFTWGLDLSGSLQGAGGVGGLLSVWDSSSLNNQPSTHFVAYDGNGNVSALVNAANAVAVAQYAYGPFGEVLRATGPVAKANPFRFSTKYQDDGTDLLYYGYRYYSAGTGRWNSKDPILENGGINLYCFLRNNSVVSVDADGRYNVRVLRKLNLICGGWSVDWIFEGQVPRKGKYFLVQEVHKDRRTIACCGYTGDFDKSKVFYEAAEFDADEKTSWIKGDSDVMNVDEHTVAGFKGVFVLGKVFPADEDIARDISSWGHQAEESHSMPSTLTVPTWWNSNRDVDSGSRSAWKDDWDCCSGNYGDRFGTLFTIPAH
ncbi:MAG TPA: RHS repeat-associated core domain-containing protein [Verrucomicrobiae bacterium]